MGPLVLDASVVIGLLDAADAHHARAVDDVEAADEASMDLVVPASAYSEALVAFARASRIRDACEAIAAMGIRASPLDPQTAERAAELRALHDRLRLPDAMVLATAHVLGGRVLTYDDRLTRYAQQRPLSAHSPVGHRTPAGATEREAEVVDGDGPAERLNRLDASMQHTKTHEDPGLRLPKADTVRLHTDEAEALG